MRRIFGPVHDIVDRWLFASVPSRQLLILHRAVLGSALLWTVVRTPFWLDQAALSTPRSSPVGVLSWLPSTQPATLSPAVVAGLATLTGGGLLLALLRPRWPSLVAFSALGFLVLATHGNSWGQVLHTENLLVLHLLVLAASPRPPTGERSPSSLTDGWPARVMALLTVGTYVVAGVAKLRYGGSDWVSGHTLQNLVAHDNLRKQLLGDWSSPLAPVLVEHRWLFGPGAVAAVAVELAAPFALLGRRTALLWSVAAWCFHLTVLGLMAVLFLYPLLGVAFLPLALSFESAESPDSEMMAQQRQEKSGGHVGDSASPA